MGMGRRGSQAAHRFICERSRARHDADAAGLVNVTRHDPDLACTGLRRASRRRESRSSLADGERVAHLDDSRAVGPDETRLVLLQHSTLHLDHVVLRNALGDANHQVQLSLHRLHDGARCVSVRVSGCHTAAPCPAARACKRWGHVDHRRVCARRLLGLSDGVEHRQPWRAWRYERQLRCCEAAAPHPSACCPPSSASRRRPFWCHMR